MFVGSLIRALTRQVHRRHDFADHAFVFEDAPVREQRGSPGLGIEQDAPAWELLVFGFTGYLSDQPPLLPNKDVAARISPEIAIIFGLVEGHAVDDQFAIHRSEE